MASPEHVSSRAPLWAPVSASIGAALDATLALDYAPDGFTGPHDLMAKLSLGDMSVSDRVVFFLPRVFASEGATLAARLMAYYLFGDAKVPYLASGTQPESRLDGEGPRGGLETDIPEPVYRIPWSSLSHTTEMAEAFSFLTLNTRNRLMLRLKSWLITQDKTDPLGWLEGKYWRDAGDKFRSIASAARADPNQPIAFGYPRPVRNDRFKNVEEALIDRTIVIGGKWLAARSAAYGLNDLRAGLGSSALNAYASGTCMYTPMPQSKGELTFDVKAIGVRYRESFDFSGEDQRFQPLGIFSPEKFYRAKSLPPPELVADQLKLLAGRRDQVPGSSPKAVGDTVSLTNDAVRQFRDKFKPRYDAAVQERNAKFPRDRAISKLVCGEFKTVCPVHEVAAHFEIKLSV